MSNELEISINEFHKLAHIISSIVHDLDMEVSGVRYDGGVIGFGYGQEARVVINRDKNVIAYDDIGKYIPVTGSSVTISLPADANIPVGGSFIVHNDGTGSVTITETTGTTNAIEHIDGSGSDSTATSYSLARNSICTIRKKDGTRWQIWGNGIS